MSIRGTCLLTGPSFRSDGADVHFKGINRPSVTPLAYHAAMPAPPLSFSAEQIQTLRGRMRLSQYDFARMLRVSIKTVQNWEQGRRAPTGPAAALLRVMDREPRAALRALHGFVPKVAADLDDAEES
jgi:DNA-binding transcriptional regulator YiaG